MRKKILFSVIFMCLCFTACGHEHTFSEATCNSPKICSTCGEIEGEKLEHVFTEADCTNPIKCSLCGITEGEALGHQWVEATCDTAKTCSVCGETEGEALGHKWVSATCRAAKTCRVCSEVEGEPLEHEWVDATYVKPKTCNKCGLSEGEKLVATDPNIDTGLVPDKFGFDKSMQGKDYNKDGIITVGEMNKWQEELNKTPEEREAEREKLLSDIKASLEEQANKAPDGGSYVPGPTGQQGGMTTTPDQTDESQFIQWGTGDYTGLEGGNVY